MSCTGFINPGPDYKIVRALGLNPAVQRYHLGFMGCYAAFPALRAAKSFCEADPAAVVLVVCAELCSLHVRTSNDPDTIMGSALFADGAAAAVVTAIRPVLGGPKAPEARFVDDDFRVLTADRRFNAGLMTVFGMLAMASVATMTCTPASPSGSSMAMAV